MIQYFRNLHHAFVVACPPPLLATIFCNHLVKLLQKIVASLEKPTHRMLLSFVIILQSLCSPNEDFRWPNERLGTNFRSTLQMASTRFGLRSFVTRPLFRTNLHYRKFVTTFNHEFEFRLKVWGKCQMRCVLFSVDATIFCNNFCKMITKDSSNPCGEHKLRDFKTPFKDT